MAKYNLLDDDDIFEEKKETTADEDSQESPKPAEPEQELEINVDDDFDIEPASLSDDEFKTDVMETAIDDESKEVIEKEPEELDEDPHFDDFKTEEEPKPKKDVSSYYTDDYDDDKQTGINYGPFIKVFVALIVLVGIYFIVDIFILSDSEVAVEEQEPVKTAAQIQQEREAAEKADFLSRVSGKINSDVRFLSGVITNVQGSAKLSSVLYYGNTFLVQIFGSSRTEIAKAQMALKEAGNSFEIISSEIRPGSNGGVLSTYSMDVSNSGASSGQASAAFASVAEFENWIKQTSATNQLRVSTITNKYLNDESNFKKYEIVSTLNGSVAGCTSFLQKLSVDGQQIKIHKLNLSAADQRSFKPGNYQLKLILELFI